MSDVRILILAGGKGTRMKTDLPKPLVLLAGKPILFHLFDQIQASRLDPHPGIVLGYAREQMEQAIGDTCEVIVQTEQLGTGHAVLTAKEAMQGVKHLIVVYGDHPFISSSALRKLYETHIASNNVLTMMTVTLPSYEDWYKIFERWGRVLRDASGNVTAIREYKDATDEQRKIFEVNPSLFCFDTAWLWGALARLKNTNASKEYYLTDVVQIAVEEGRQISTSPIAPEEVIGVNSLEELAIAEKVLGKK